VIVLLVLLGIFAAAYSAMSLNSAKTAAVQNNYQNDYITANSIRQSIVDNIQNGKNGLVTGIAADVTQGYKYYLQNLADYEAACLRVDNYNNNPSHADSPKNAPSSTPPEPIPYYVQAYYSNDPAHTLDTLKKNYAKTNFTDYKTYLKNTWDGTDNGFTPVEPTYGKGSGQEPVTVTTDPATGENLQITAAIKYIPEFSKTLSGSTTTTQLATINDEIEVSVNVKRFDKNDTGKLLSNVSIGSKLTALYASGSGSGTSDGTVNKPTVTDPGSWEEGSSGAIIEATGNVLITGNYTIMGDVKAGGDVELAWGAKVTGNIYAGGNVKLGGGNIVGEVQPDGSLKKGVISACGSVTAGWGCTVGGFLAGGTIAASGLTNTPNPYSAGAEVSAPTFSNPQIKTAYAAAKEKGMDPDVLDGAVVNTAFSFNSTPERLTTLSGTVDVSTDKYYEVSSDLTLNSLTLNGSGRLFLLVDAGKTVTLGDTIGDTGKESRLLIVANGNASGQIVKLSPNSVLNGQIYMPNGTVQVGGTAITDIAYVNGTVTAKYIDGAKASWNAETLYVKRIAGDYSKTSLSDAFSKTGVPAYAVGCTGTSKGRCIFFLARNPGETSADTIPGLTILTGAVSLPAKNKDTDKFSGDFVSQGAISAGGNSNDLFANNIYCRDAGTGTGYAIQTNVTEIDENLYADGKVQIQNGTLIKGNIYTSGTLTTAGSENTISGNVYCDTFSGTGGNFGGNVYTLKGGSFAMGYQGEAIGGNVVSGGPFTVGGTVKGTIFVKGDLTFSYSGSGSAIGENASTGGGTGGATEVLPVVTPTDPSSISGFKAVSFYDIGK